MRPFTRAGRGVWTKLASIDLGELPAGTISIEVVTTTASYTVTVAPYPQTYLAGNRRVINGVRVERERDIHEMLNSRVYSEQELLNMLAGRDKFPNSASRDIKLGHPWQHDDEVTGPVQAISLWGRQQI